MESPGNKRKRAVIACNYCRRRKRKCDGKQPVCSLCQESNNSDCEYQNIDSRVSASLAEEVSEIQDKLLALDQTLSILTQAVRNQSQQSLTPVPQPSPNASTPIVQASPNIATAYTADDNSALVYAPHIHNPREETVLDIPLSHSTTTGNLLRSAPARALLGDYPSGVFLHIELRRPLGKPLTLRSETNGYPELPRISETEVETLVGEFFNRIHPYHPVLHQSEFEQEHHRGLTPGLGLGLSSVLVLIVMALGSAAKELPPHPLPETWMPGIQFFRPAMDILLAEASDSFGGDIRVSQALYLAALYYGYLARPLQAWRLTHMASTDLQLYWTRRRTAFGDHRDAPDFNTVVRLAWAVFVLECDINAERHMPRSGIEQMVENLPFPASESPLNPSTLRWLANLSSRRLLNRIHHSLYNHGSYELEESLSAVLPSVFAGQGQSSQSRISEELNHQLQAWFDLLPTSIQPDLSQRPCSVEDAVLTMRYHAAGDIIHRPFLLQVCMMAPSQEPDDALLRDAHQCIYHCRGYLSTVGIVVEAPTASLEIFLHSTLAVVLLLTFAAMSPHLAARVPDVEVMQKSAITLVERWAFPDSSIETMLSILRTLRAKCLGRYTANFAITT